MVQRRRGRGAPQCADSTIGDSNDGEESDTGNANKNGATVYWKRAPRALNNRDVSDTHIGNGVVSCTHASEPVDSRGLHVLILPTTTYICSRSRHEVNSSIPSTSRSAAS